MLCAIFFANFLGEKKRLFYVTQGCPNEMNDDHLLNCSKLNKETEIEEFNQILNGTNQQKLIILKKLK